MYAEIGTCTSEESATPCVLEAEPVESMLISSIDDEGKIKLEQLEGGGQDADSTKNVELLSNLPNLAILHPSFKRAEAALQKVCNGLFEEVGAAKVELGYSSLEIDRLWTTIGRDIDLKLRYPSVKAVACLGPSGAGKSSSMNSILAKRGLAIKNDGGDCGINVTHECMTALPEQAHMYISWAIYYRPKAINKLVERHANTFFKKTFSANAGNVRDNEEEEDGEEEIDTKMDTAYEFSTSSWRI
ncbi:hypothetical protein K431DRAFT_298344 [Polychaeton citri CBS 116435]|uniref:Uncharacterized protein n=1 Tax=Polychaeton citri CBS 116435 TaxID=1314669 RepID=A0A9P4PZ91_9PEZI|nr:hypothetical protein K431DRAFT_298344 [Polychaeton citri CBS 116435]